MSMFYVGLLHFNEAFADDLRQKLNALPILHKKDGTEVKIETDNITIHEVSIHYPTKYNLILDRGSHLVKHAMGVFVAFAFRGIYIINNPLSFHYFIANKDVGYAMAYELGINIPPTFVLPPYYTRGRPYPHCQELNWNRIVEQMNWPCFIKPAEGRGGFQVHKAYNLEQLLEYYEGSGCEIMTVQKAVQSPYPWQVRCLCLGRKIIPIKYFFKGEPEYRFEENFLTPQQGLRIIESCQILNRLFGYEMNSVEFIIDEQGEPWAIDFNNPIPDARREILSEIFYNDYLAAMIQRISEIATQDIQYPFLPEINAFAEIARMPVSREEKFQLARQVAQKYYNPPV